MIASLVAAAPIGGKAAVHLAHASAWAVFAVGAVLILVGAFGVILLRNPVHCALMLVTTLFGVAVEFVNQSADFLAAVQIIVYAGAIVILFLFVIMFLGVDRKDTIGREPFRIQRPLAIVVGLALFAEIWALSRVQNWTSGKPSVAGPLNPPILGSDNLPVTSNGHTVTAENVQALGQAIYTRYLLPFEMTSALLVIAVIAAVVLARSRERAAGELARSDQAQRGAMGAGDFEEAGTQ
jgi:NADH-quinone oxidoreductase subunit J